MNVKSKITRILCLGLALISVMALLASCGKRLNMQADKLTDKKLGVTYKLVPGVTPKSVSNEEYATLKINKVKTVFYRIEGEEPEVAIADEYGEVYVSDDRSIASLEEFEPKSVMVCSNSEIVMAFGEIADADTVGKIVDLFKNGQYENYPNVPTEFYALRFESDKYPSLYFCMKLICTADKVYINYRDAYSGMNICVDAGNIFDEIIKDYAEGEYPGDPYYDDED